MINEKIPKVIPPDGETENVNDWELMEDLEDTNLLKSPHHVRSFSFHVLTNPYDQLKSGKVILYFTSLRGVRKMYEDCCHVRMILKGLGVKIDERDVSMHAWFKEELKLGEEYSGGVLLPRVFLGRKYIAGADEICRMHDNGQLEKVVESYERVEHGVCEGCGDGRFVPCETCYGSRMKQSMMKKMSVASNDAQIAMRMGFHDVRVVVINFHRLLWCYLFTGTKMSKVQAETDSCKGKSKASFTGSTEALFLAQTMYTHAKEFKICTH